MGKEFFMDLYAYLQIEDYDALAKANGIEIPRLRGYRWMENEQCLSKEDIDNCLNEARARAYEHVLTADPPFSINPEYYTLSYTTDQRKKKYLIQEEQTRVYYKRFQMGSAAWKAKKGSKVLPEEGIERRKTTTGNLEQVCRAKRYFVYPCPSWDFKLEQYYVEKFQDISVVSGWM